MRVLSIDVVTVAHLAHWKALRSDFLSEIRTMQTDAPHAVRVQRGFEKFSRAGRLFTYLDEGLVEGSAIPATSNRIEGGVNRQPRIMFGENRGWASTGGSRPSFGGATFM